MTDKFQWKSSDGLLTIKTTCAKLLYFLLIMTVYVMFEKKTHTKSPDRIVNIDKEKYEINSMHSQLRNQIVCYVY
jgi:hypothetical protein